MMSGFRTGERRATTPHATIGCQELLRTPNIGHSGFLRKQLTFKKNNKSFLSHINKVLNKIWVHRYVVLSDGSLYHFESETSKKPNGSYSLMGYNQVVLAGDVSPSQHPWAFKIVHETGAPHKAKYFQAASETELKTWQREIRGQIVIANGGLHNKPTRLSQRARMPEPQCEEEDLDMPLYEIGDFDDKISAISDDDSDDRDDYLEIDEEMQKSVPAERNHRPLPAPPPTNSGKEKMASPTNPKERTLTRDQADDHIKILNLMSVKSPGYTEDEQDEMPSMPAAPPIRPAARIPGNIPTPVSPPHNHSEPKSPVPCPPAKPLPSLPAKKNFVPDPPANVDPPVRTLPGKSDRPKFGVPMIGLEGGPPATRPKPGPRNLQSVTSQEESEAKTPERKVPQPPSRPVAAFPKSPTSRPEPDRLTWKDFYWSGPDNQACQQILRNINEEGIFLVRESDQGINKTLVCFIEGGVRKFRISTTDDGRYSLESNWTFSSIEELLQHYMCNNLPNRNMKLTAPYSKRT